MKDVPKAIVVGSFNRAKAAEIAGLLRETGVPVRPLSDFPGVSAVPEDGRTFAENARLKALGLIAQLPHDELLGVLAEDSGLEVDALGGRPGIYSARYVSDTATDPERVGCLLAELRGVHATTRAGRFRCHLVLAGADRIFLEADGVVEGRIAHASAGDFGFGYDPIFIPHGYDRTFAELGPEVKHRISHRAVALREFRKALAQFIREL